MSASCPCAKLAVAVRGDTARPPLSLSAAVRTAPWLELRRCSTCGQYWQLDVPDRLQVTLAVKVADPDRWPKDDAQERKQFLLETRGVSETRCRWRDCTDPALSGLAFCVDHAWNMGVRE